MNSFALMLLIAIHLELDYRHLFKGDERFLIGMHFLLTKELIHKNTPDDIDFSATKKGIDVIKQAKYSSLKVL